MDGMGIMAAQPTPRATSKHGFDHQNCQVPKMEALCKVGPYQLQVE